MRIGICDDEKKERSIVHDWLIKNYHEFKECNFFEFESGYALLQFLSSKSLDLIFMDCCLGSMDGIETSLKIREINEKVKIIGLSSHSDFAVFGYEAKFIRFILKDNFEKEIKPAFNEVLKEYEQYNKSFFSLQTDMGKVDIQIRKTVYVSTELRKRAVHYIDGRIFRTYATLKEIYEMLPDSEFVTIHKGFILNLHHVTSLIKNDIETSLGDKLYVPNARLKDVSDKFADLYLKR